MRDFDFPGLSQAMKTLLASVFSSLRKGNDNICLAFFFKILKHYMQNYHS